MSGTAGYALRLEGIQIVLVKKVGGTPPGSLYKGIDVAAGTPAMVDLSAAALKSLPFSAIMHIQGYGDRTFVQAGGAAKLSTLGTSGEAKRVEAMTLSLIGGLPEGVTDGSIEYRTHVQSYGWEADWRTEGEVSGTEGEAKRLEALQIRLTGDLATKYDVYYRTHIQSIGWTDWARNGEECGSAGYGYRMEAMEIVIVPKDTVAPGPHANYFYQK